MADYKVCFYNVLTDSTGHQHRPCQREIKVVGMAGEDEAVTAAIAIFEREERVSHWTVHAHTYECKRIDPDGPHV